MNIAWKTGHCISTLARPSFQVGRDAPASADTRLDVGLLCASLALGCMLIGGLLFLFPSGEISGQPVPIDWDLIADEEAETVDEFIMLHDSGNPLAPATGFHNGPSASDRRRTRGETGESAHLAPRLESHPVPASFPATPALTGVAAVTYALESSYRTLCSKVAACCDVQRPCRGSPIETGELAFHAENLAADWGNDAIRLDAENLELCLQKISSAPCHAPFVFGQRRRCIRIADGPRECVEVGDKSTEPLSCRIALRGTVSTGELCIADEQCGGREVCNKYPSSQEQGVCAPIQRQQAACVSHGSCSGELLCVRGRCHPPGGINAKCDGGLHRDCTAEGCRSGTCQRGLNCLEGVCRPFGRAGAACRAHNDCDRLLHCNQEGVCVEVSAPGASCTSHRDCAGFCNHARGQCEGPLEDGESCWQDFQCRGHCRKPEFTCASLPNPGHPICRELLPLFTQRR